MSASLQGEPGHSPQAIRTATGTQALLPFLVATSNRHKLQEIQAILGRDGNHTCIGLDEAGAMSIEQPDETGTTFEENAVIKARYYADRTGLPTIADDSGLVVDALAGAPGVQSARWMGESTPYEQKNRHLLTLLEGVPVPERSARFVCVVACAWPAGQIFTARGEHEGRIHHEISGHGGFGYDPVFFSNEAGQTFGTLSAEQKNSLSHRARAFQALLAFLNSRPNSPVEP